MKKLSILPACLLALAVSVPDTSARADDPAFLTIAAGAFDFNRQKDDGTEFRLEYRSDYKLWNFKPFATAAVADNGMTFIGAGILMDIFMGRRIVVTPSFAPTWWRGKTDKLDMGHAIEFRSQLEVAYRFDNRSRLGVSISHYSNASLGDDNPGTESLLVNYSLPISDLF